MVETPRYWIRFFSGIVRHSNIPEFRDIDYSVECISHNFGNHLSVSAIRNAFNSRIFSSSKVSVDDLLKEINKLGNRKAIQGPDITVKILKQNADIFGSYICQYFNVIVDEGTFPSVQKHINITKRIKNF